MSDAFEKVYFRGKLMDNKTKAFLEAMEERLGYELTVVQGCYNAGGVSASAGTHDGGGVVDLAAWDHERKVRVARELGAFAWFRPDLPGVWGEHIHLGIRNHGRLAPAAQAQQRDYDAKPPRNGLASHASDNTWHPSPPVEFKYPVKEKPVGPKPTKVTQARDRLVEAIHAAGDAAALLEATDAARVVAQNKADELRALRRDLRSVLEGLPKR